MPAVRYKINMRNVTLSDEPGDCVPILTKSGGRNFCKWLGFIDVNVARQLPSARPVKLDVVAYSPETSLCGNWQELQPGETIQGCMVEGGVYGITHSVMPRVVTRQLKREH